METPKKISIFEKLQGVFTKKPMTREYLGRDLYMILRFLSMKPEYTQAINNVQKYQGCLQHRSIILLQHIFDTADKAPYLELIKKEVRDDLVVHDEETQGLLRDLFKVGKKRLREYMPNLWWQQEDIKAVWGL